MLDTPVLFIIYNRPDVTQRVFNKIREIKPKKLYVAADGPKNKEDKYLCDQTRDRIAITWDCELNTLFRDQNHGCKLGVSSAIDWVFNFENRAIILEDDTLPDLSFFRFCEELLNEYENQKKVFSITGVNWQYGKKMGDASYYFSSYPGIWGWATWKNRWELFDINFEKLEENIENNFLSYLDSSEEEQIFHINNMKNAKLDLIDSWGFAWHYAYYRYRGLCIIPNKNLITNIGFDKRATHTKHSKSWKANISSKEIEFPLVHPSKIERNFQADRIVARRNFFNKLTLLDKMRFKLYKSFFSR